MTNALSLNIKVFPHGEGLPLPTYHSEQAAGADLAAAITTDQTIVLAPGEFKLVPAGFAMALPAGYEAQIRPRSGLAFRHGVTVLNSPGTIDSDYRGEIKVLLINHGPQNFEITHGMRIAQMVIAPVTRAEFIEAGELDDSARGVSGFGSTG